MSLDFFKLTKSFNMGVSNKYSSCPLKKRPVQIVAKEEPLDVKKKPAAIFVKDEPMDIKEFKDRADSSEPENLSTKPEDLSLSSVKVATPPPNLIPVSWKQESNDRLSPEPHKHRLTAFSAPQRDSGKGGVLEPLNLNTPVEHPIAYRPTPQYPPQYVPYSYPFTRELYQPQYHPNTLYHARIQMFPRDSNSPPDMFPSPPVRPVPSMPHQGFIPYPGGLSPASSTSQSPPPISPEDLSSPGSVGSSGSSGLGSLGRRRKDSAPRYQCPHCNKSYSTFSGLSKHQQFHCAANEASQAKKSFSCKYCEKVYVSLGALKMHIRTHTLPCKCTVCGKAFSRPWLLQGHVRTHTGEKPFSCQHCGRAFADRSNLRAHLQTHSDVKKYSCPTCAKTFSRMSLLTKHAEGGCPGGLSPQDLIEYQHQHNMQIPVSPV